MTDDYKEAMFSRNSRGAIVTVTTRIRTGKYQARQNSCKERGVGYEDPPLGKKILENDSCLKNESVFFKGCGSHYFNHNPVEGHRFNNMWAAQIGIYMFEK